MNGFIFIDKPQGLTSFAAIKEVSRITGQKKAGHTGTLDPMATGVLTVALGAATRFIELMGEKEKVYRARFKLGITTDTLDITGRVLTQLPVICTKNEVFAVAKSFVGQISQLPPMYSAIKKDGVRLYDLARRGIEIERQPRKVTVYCLDISSVSVKENEYELLVACSGGTYIRSLVADIGQKLGCGAVMTALRREMENAIDLSNCFTFEQLKNMSKDEMLKVITATDKMLPYPAITVTAAQAKRFLNGGSLFLNRVKGVASDGYYNLYSSEGRFLGVASAQTQDNILTVKKVYTGD